MNKLEPDWRWGTPEGNREFDRLMDSQLTFREKIQWIEDMETMNERFAEARSKRLHEGAAKNLPQG
jgi:hypothetical protein